MLLIFLLLVYVVDYFGLGGELTKTELSQEEKPEEATVCAYGTEGAH